MNNLSLVKLQQPTFNCMSEILNQSFQMYKYIWNKTGHTSKQKKKNTIPSIYNGVMPEHTIKYIQHPNQQLPHFKTAYLLKI